jgi:hypothetical protein
MARRSRTDPVLTEREIRNIGIWRSLHPRALQAIELLAEKAAPPQRPKRSPIVTADDEDGDKNHETKNHETETVAS